MEYYYHSAATRTLVAVPSEPTVCEKKKRGETISWVVSTEWTITRADNSKHPDTHQWLYSVRAHPHETYNAHRDTREQAVSYFVMNHYPTGYDRIDLQTYNRLRDEYSAIIEEKQKAMNAE